MGIAAGAGGKKCIRFVIVKVDKVVFGAKSTSGHAFWRISTLASLSTTSAAAILRPKSVNFTFEFVLNCMPGMMPPPSSPVNEDLVPILLMQFKM